jgi:hypothetical protein
MSDFIMCEVDQWLHNLCADADKKGIRPVDMMYLLSDMALKYAMKERAMVCLLERDNRVK